jgi:hypothetical protein
LHKLSSLPASDITVSIYLIYVAETAKSGSKIDQIVYGISWAHKLAGLKNPCQSDLVNFVREGAHRKIGHMITKKEPITPDILKKIVCTYGNKHCNLKDLRIASMCLICYSGFFTIFRISKFEEIRYHIFSYLH